MEGTEPLSSEQLGVLDRLRGLKTLEGFYLASGSAVAYHLRHRVSLDLDIFGSPGAPDLQAVRRDVMSALGDVEVVDETDVAVHLKTGAGLIDLVAYPYPLLEPPASGPSGFPVAGLTDLATMKLSTIARRGLRRDFWDLYQILDYSGASLQRYLDAYLERFGKHESDLYHVIRSLTWFEDAEKEPAYPAGMTPGSWARIKTFFTERATGLFY